MVRVALHAFLYAPNSDKAQAVSLYVFCIEADLAPNENITVDVHLVFALDGQAAGDYGYTPNNLTSDFAYQVPVYVNTALTPPDGGAQHNLTIQSYANMLFDYAIYT